MPSTAGIGCGRNQTIVLNMKNLMPSQQQKKQKYDKQMPVQFLTGVGPSKAKIFQKFGIETITDLLGYFPRDWVFIPKQVKIANAKPKQDVTILGQIESTDYLMWARPKMFEAVVADETAACKIVWFNGGYLQKQIEPGQMIMASGKMALYKSGLQLTNPEFVILDQQQSQELKPADCLSGGVYKATAKLSSRQIKKIITPLLKHIPSLIEEIYDDEFLKKAQLIDRAKAFMAIHHPKNKKQLALAKRRLKYDELFLMQLAMALKRYRVKNFSTAYAIKLDKRLDGRIRKRFPFDLTEDQNQVVKQIAEDIALPVPMNRLLQGDVGCGKTPVALYAALAAIAGGCQVAIMAPTEILAKQHFESMQKYLAGSKVKRTLMTGAMAGKKRQAIIKQIAEGKVDIVASTVAILNEDVVFKKLALIIIDEQHKFGVHQRSKLRKKSSPHCLVMTATPIPRTLTMAAFGDLDLSVIKHLPKGRGGIVTKFVEKKNLAKCYKFIEDKLKNKQQAYFVYPRIEAENSADGKNKNNVKAAKKEYKLLKEKIFPQFNVGFVHGQMKSEEKQKIMADFADGKIDVLVATIIIEVGIDVPNATVMVIETADRFGLAQLHQLRGRIGRGKEKSYCFLLSDSDSEIAKQRIDMMVKTNDGFEIAQKDFQMRGPGELLSDRQHGIANLKIADIVEDYDLMMAARRDAFQLVNKDPMLNKPINKNLRKLVVKRFAGTIELADIG